MKIEWKKAFKIAGILCAIAGTAAVLVSLANVVTAPIIAQNKVDKEQKGLKKIFGEEAVYGEKVEIKDSDTLIAYYPVTWEGSKEARVYSTSGSNAYGTVSLLIGITSSYSLYNLVVMENTESYGSTLIGEYIDPLLVAEDKDDALDNVKCGATYGAKLVRGMVLDAKEHYKGEAKV